jgi:hypothetical protein
MRLKDRNGPIPGGLWYEYSDDKGNTYRVNGMETVYGKPFSIKVSSDMTNNNVAIPENLDYLIEQQICGRIPGQYCWQEAGDKVANVIHKFANLGDRVASSLGVAANLEQRAKGCMACKKRREALNQALG